MGGLYIPAVYLLVYDREIGRQRLPGKFLKVGTYNKVRVSEHVQSIEY